MRHGSLDLLTITLPPSEKLDSPQVPHDSGWRYPFIGAEHRPEALGIRRRPNTTHGHDRSPSEHSRSRSPGRLGGAPCRLAGWHLHSPTRVHGHASRAL